MGLIEFVKTTIKITEFKKNLINWILKEQEKIWQTNFKIFRNFLVFHNFTYSNSFQSSQIQIQQIKLRSFSLSSKYQNYQLLGLGNQGFISINCLVKSSLEKATQYIQSDQFIKFIF
ncbi:hypothetical protein pb186bvf_014190 [Paramecium bursaria]